MFRHAQKMEKDIFYFIVFYPNFWEVFGETDKSIKGVFDNGHVIVLKQFVKEIESIFEILLDLESIGVVAQTAEEEYSCLSLPRVTTFKHSSNSIRYFVHNLLISTFNDSG